MRMRMSKLMWISVGRNLPMSILGVLLMIIFRDRLNFHASRLPNQTPLSLVAKQPMIPVFWVVKLKKVRNSFLNCKRNSEKSMNNFANSAIYSPDTKTRPKPMLRFRNDDTRSSSCYLRKLIIRFPIERMKLKSTEPRLRKLLTNLKMKLRILLFVRCAITASPLGLVRSQFRLHLWNQRRAANR